MRNKDRTRERPTIKLVELSIYRHVVDLIHEHHITNEIRTEHARQWACLMYHAACNVEFQPPVGRTHSWRFSIFYKICRWFIVFGRIYSVLVLYTDCFAENKRKNEWKKILLGRAVDRSVDRAVAYKTFNEEANWASHEAVPHSLLVCRKSYLVYQVPSTSIYDQKR